jgi:hypothetical protein
MISTQPEIETLINNKFMKKIQPNSVTYTYEINKPDVYNNRLDIGERPEPTIIPDAYAYNYINDESLHKVIESDLNTEYNYILYNVIDVTVKPFVKFLMYNSNNIMKFPNEKASIENNDELTDSDESDSDLSEIVPFDDNEYDNSDDMLNLSENSSESEYDIYLPEQCSQYLEKNFGIEYETVDEKYKGHVKIGDRLYIFINVSNTDLVFPENDVFSWVIIDEIINKKLSNNIPICNIVIDMFSNNNLIKNIYNENNDIIEYPICVYICKKEGDSQYVNVGSQPITNMSLISDKIQHPIFGNASMFSTNKIINDDKNVERYGLFTEDAIYVLHSNFTKSEIGTINNKSCVRFLYETNEMWSVKNTSLYSYI